MATACKECGKKLSFFSMSSICPECKDKIEARKVEEKEAGRIFKEEKEGLEAAIISSKSISGQQLDIIRRLNKKLAIKLYNKIYSEYEKDSELDDKEIEVLQKVQNAANLSNEEISYLENVLPYVYVSCIKKEGRLPTTDVQFTDAAPVILKKDEIIHFGNATTLKELRTVSLGYKGGSRGVSLRIMKGVSYRVGSHRGHIVKEERYIDVSRGGLIITNQRIYLYPAPRCKPVSIPLNKILSYNCFRDCLEVYKDGREKGYMFFMNSGAVEVAGICLNFLLNR
jgi:hypothetical protein